MMDWQQANCIFRAREKQQKAKHLSDNPASGQQRFIHITYQPLQDGDAHLQISVRGV